VATERQNKAAQLNKLKKRGLGRPRHIVCYIKERHGFTLNKMLQMSVWDWNIFVTKGTETVSLNPLSVAVPELDPSKLSILFNGVEILRKAALA